MLMRTNSTFFNRIQIVAASLIIAATFSSQVTLGQGINKSGTLADALGWNLSGYHIVYASLTPTDNDQSGKIDGVFTLSQAAIAAWGDYSIAVRFSNWGSKTAVIDCRIGTTGFGAVNEVPFEFGKKYDCWVETAVYDKKYNVYIKADGMDKPVMVADQYAYRNSDITELTIWSSLYNPTENQNELVVENLKLVNAVGDLPGSGVDKPASENLVKAYPSPDKRSFTIEAAGSFDYDVYNMAGVVVAKGQGYNRSLTGELLSKGAYLIKVNRNGHINTLRIVKS